MIAKDHADKFTATDIEWLSPPTKKSALAAALKRKTPKDKKPPVQKKVR